MHVEVVTGLDLNNFILAFSRFINLRGPENTFFSDNSKSFCAAEKQLPLLLDSTKFHFFAKTCDYSNWVRIPPYSPRQAGSLESMVKLIKTALSQVLGEARRLPCLIELQTFVSDTIRVVNDRPLTTISDMPNDLTPLTPSCFLGQQLSPNSPVSPFHNEEDLRCDFQYCATLAQRFWLQWMNGYLPCLQGRNKWRTFRENLVVVQ